MSFPTPPPDRQDELIDQISSLLPTQVEGPWTSLVFTDRSLVTYGEDAMLVRRPDGTIDKSQAAPRRVAKLTMKLRQVMYRPGVGTWLSAEWHVDNHGDSTSARVDFNYDDEPDWSEPVEPGDYALDLEDFPHTEEATPAWLKQKVREAKASG